MNNCKASTTIYNLSFAELTGFFLENNQKGYRAQQVWEGLYKKLYQSWNEFSNLPGDIRIFLDSKFHISSLNLKQKLVSLDSKTEKYLFELPDGNPVESVLLYKRNRITCCISTQSGCPVGCVFCATGLLGLNRNLTNGEIIDQLAILSRIAQERGSKVDNVVLMGMGEPLLNYENTLNAIRTFNSGKGLNLGARRITLSTIGIPSGIEKLASEGLQVNLAISLHSADTSMRENLVPIAKKYTLSQIIDASKKYIELTNRRITFEYVMINGVNDSPKDAKALIYLIQGINCHVNLIPLNPNPHYAGDSSSLETIKQFGNILLAAGIPVTIRFSQGVDIQAACGQLAARIEYY